VLCCDVDKEKIKKLENGEMPFYEPGLKEQVVRGIEKKRLRFTIDPKETVEFGDVVFNCVGTPSQPDGSADLQYVFQVAESVAKYGKSRKYLVDKSTVPPGTAHKLTAHIKSMNPNADIVVVSNPEFLKEGAAVQDFNHPDRIVIGAQDNGAYKVMREVYSGLLRTYIPVVDTTWETAEMIKYANNCFLATKISFINEIANICDKVGADVKTIAAAIGMDYRISPKFLSAGIGYGGSCFPKDVKALAHTASLKGYTAELLNAVDQLNERQKTVIVEKLKKHIPDLSGKTIALLGLSFKPKTSDIRESPSINVISELLAQNAKIKAFDPEAMNEAKVEFGDKIELADNLYEAATDADAVLLLTEWDDFRNVDFDKLKSVMTGTLLLDGRNIYDSLLVEKAGLVYEGIGRL
jgi:UDPglucose 6-dehydrogenase